MRLWHKDLIPVLPRQQLIGQWRECCLIAKQISEKGEPNHILVNKIMDYPLSHLCYYGRLIECELASRGYKVHGDCFDKWLRNEKGAVPYPYPEFEDLFKDWHNDRLSDERQRVVCLHQGNAKWYVQKAKEFIRKE